MATATVYFRYELIWNSLWAKSIIQDTRYYFRRNGWARIFGLLSKNLEYQPAEILLVGSSHFRQIVPTNQFYSADNPIQFHHHISNLTFQLYFEKDLILKHKAKKIIFSFNKDEFNFHFNVEKPYFNRPLQLVDITKNNKIKERAISTFPSHHVKNNYDYLDLWLTESYLLRRTYFDLVPSFIIDNFLKTNLTKSIAGFSPKHTTDNLPNNNKVADGPTPVMQEYQISITGMYLDELFTELIQSGAEIVLIEGFNSPQCNTPESMKHAQYFQDVLSSLANKHQIRFLKSHQLPIPPADSFTDCLHISRTHPARMPFINEYLAKVLSL